MLYPLGMLGFGEIAIIALVVLLLFGAKRIPELMKGIGKGISSFKKGLNEVDEDIKNAGTSKPKSDNKE